MIDRAHPYVDLLEYQFWKSGVVDIAPGQYDPVVNTKFKISKNDSVVTLGSCFAQHLSRFIKERNLNFYSLEKTPKNQNSLDFEKNFSNNFSALYGNIYTARQASQLLKRSQGWEPAESVWTSNGRFYDPFRPTVFVNGFPDKETLLDERKSHLEIVHHLFHTCDVVVFTLGMSEAWVSKIDGAVFPVAPGVAAGKFDGNLHLFTNFTFDQIYSDLNEFCLLLKSFNQQIKIILTVSPVALNATFEPQNILISNTYSKAVLRAAAGEIANAHHFVDYFPSFEIVTNPHNHCRYLEDDLRNVTQLGVSKVMTIFESHYLELSDTIPEYEKARISRNFEGSEIDQISQIICDEDLITNEPK